ncbi:MAG: zinc-binding dehydrogenase [Caldilineaceae bacterium]|nr:zinc-binding dehydrogenase [Caldilineaceae bacterium]
MRAVQITAPGQSTILDIPKPEPRLGEVLVRTTQVSLCGSDTHSFLFGAPEQYPLRPGMSGHEVLGIVEEINAPGSSLLVGDHALVLVTNNQGMAEYAVAPIENVLPLANTRPAEHLLQAQQLGTIFYAAQHLPNVVNKDVAVIGQGSAGLWWNFVMRRMGARRVIAVDLQAHRLAIAGHFGATHTIHNLHSDAVEQLEALTDGTLADVVIEAAGEPDSINLAIDLVKRYGWLFYFGVPRAHVMSFRMLDFFRKNPSVKSMVGALQDPGHSCTRMALELIANGEANVGPMITHHIPFEQVQEAYELQYTRDEGAVKIVVDMPGLATLNGR